MKVISILANNRLEYIAETLKALARADGIGEYRVMFFVEPGNPATLELIENSPIRHREIWDLPPHHVPTAEEVQRGVEENERIAENTFFCLEHAFQAGDFVIHLEDDVLLCRDALRYFEWATERFRADADTYAVCSYRKTGRDEGLIPANSGRVLRKPDEFYPSGWGTWRERWERLFKPIWDSTNPYGWDMTILFRLCPQIQKVWNAAYSIPEDFHRLYAVLPFVTRSHNIGAVGRNCNFSSFPRFFSSDDLPCTDQSRFSIADCDFSVTDGDLDPGGRTLYTPGNRSKNRIGTPAAGRAAENNNAEGG
jgi:hypothetical protein